MGAKQINDERDLFVDEITSIGAVPHGDNPEAGIVFWKSKNANPARVESTQGANVSLDITALPEDVQEEVTELVKSHAELTEQVAALTEQVEELTPEADPVDDASDEVQALIAKRDEQIASLAKKLEDESAARRDSEFVAQVREDNLEVLLGDANEIGPVLRELSDAAPDAFNKMYQPILAAAQREELAKTLAEYGANSGEVDPQAQKAAWIAKQREAGDDRSDADLAVAFWDSHPDAVMAEREN